MSYELKEDPHGIVPNDFECPAYGYKVIGFCSPAGALKKNLMVRIRYTTGGETTRGYLTVARDFLGKPLEIDEEHEFRLFLQEGKSLIKSAKEAGVSGPGVLAFMLRAHRERNPLGAERVNELWIEVLGQDCYDECLAYVKKFYTEFIEDVREKYGDSEAEHVAEENKEYLS